MVVAGTAIERFEVTVGPFTVQARRAGRIPETAAERFNAEQLDHLWAHPRRS